jgi:cystathionine gamma-synthase
VRAFVENLRYFSLAESLGGVESLVCHPASMTHAPVSEERKAAAGVTPTLIRLSVGLEGADDLVADVLAALDAARTAPQLAAVAAAGC